MNFFERQIRTGGAFALALMLSAPPLGAMAQEATPIPPTTVNAEGVLTIRRNATESELRELAKSLAEAKERSEALAVSLAGIEKTTAGIRTALVDSAAKRKGLERQVLADERRLKELEESQSKVKASLHSRRGLLSEVLAALQRMGRNPPPALLVTPDDALSSVRSAILLGAVVPGIRGETEKLAADLLSLGKLRTEIAAQKESYVKTMASALEEEKRMAALIAENDKLSTSNRTELAKERKRAEQLAARATSLEGLISSLERDIASAREAAALAKAEDLRRQNLSAAEIEKAKREAATGLPDKNRIAPAYAFSTLTAKLDLPVAGDVLRSFGDEDGTGHAAQGLTVAAGPGLVVTAPADGWVMFAGPFRSYGQMVIMNAGENYHIVLSGMDMVTARQGQFVVAGEPIGQMGAKRIASAAGLNLVTDRPTLYIEFRKDGKPVDSRPWWSAKDLGKARNDT
ncbi:murein hydrolase activator EnvC [Rhizobium sp. KVB221]|uniref:Murein hydrolase activator EnvC n=1 Tax=Rhizobium setariae TaxID=2801340 RepID=A0A936YTX8_9HYPH|nr:murein hydrolase activator EnvC [Rhizobium setariae]MBL0374921.1 murein hydrolase activator EnvC [Rhizobium setariae]